MNKEAGTKNWKSHSELTSVLLMIIVHSSAWYTIQNIFIG